MDKLYVTWQDIENFVDDVCKIYKNDFTGVYGPPRGGSIFAVLISHRMNIPMLAAPADGCMIIDDICDSGVSMLHYQSKQKSGQRYKIVTMYYKPKSVVKPDYYGEEVPDDLWIVFPWERD